MMEGYFDRSAETYDNKQVTDAERDDMICTLARELCGIPSKGNKGSFRVLDVGAGTGALSLRLLGVGAGTASCAPIAVCAVDLSREMLSVLRSKAEAAGLGADRLCTVHADLCATPGAEAVAAVEAASEGALFDAACSSFAMHHMDDVAACAHAVHELLRPGARVAFFDLLHEPHTPLFHPLSAHAFVTRHGLAPAELEAWFRAAGFVDVRAWRCAEFAKRCVDAPQDDPVRVFGIVVVTGTKPAQ